MWSGRCRKCINGMLLYSIAAALLHFCADSESVRKPRWPIDHSARFLLLPLPTSSAMAKQRPNLIATEIVIEKVLAEIAGVLSTATSVFSENY